MKKVVSIVVSTLILLTTCITLCSCSKDHWEIEKGCEEYGVCIYRTFSDKECLEDREDCAYWSDVTIDDIGCIKASEISNIEFLCTYEYAHFFRTEAKDVTRDRIEMWKNTGIILKITSTDNFTYYANMQRDLNDFTDANEIIEYFFNVNGISIKW